MPGLNMFCFITNLAITALCAVLLPIVPVLTRKAFLFGVKVPEHAQEHPEAKMLKRRYVVTCLIGMFCMLALDIAQFVFWPDITLLALCYFPFLIAVVQAAAFIPCWKKAVALKDEHGWGVPATVYAQSRAPYSRGSIAAVPWGYYLLSLALIIVGAVIALNEYPALPNMIPTHFDINMNPDAWAPKSYGTVLTMPIVNLCILAFMALISITIVKTKLQVSPQDPALSFAQHRLYRRWMGHGLGVLTLGTVAGMIPLGLIGILPDFSVSFGFTMFALTLPCVPLIAISIRIGQGGCKLKPKITEADTLAAGYGPSREKPPVPGRGDDKYWALGMFYHNPEDPAILVEDRFGNNIGFNYSRLSVKIGVALFIAMLVGMYVWMTPLLLSLI